MTNILFPKNTIKNPMGFDAQEALEHVAQTQGRGRSFSEVTTKYPEKPVVIFGGGTSAVRDHDSQGRSYLEACKEGGINVMAGSAVRLLNPDKIKGDETPVSSADWVVFNAVDGGDQSAYYKDSLDDAVSQKIQNIALASYNAPEAFDIAKAKMGVPYVFRYNALLQGAEYGDEPVIGAGSTAPTAAVALMLSLGHREFTMVGVDAGELQPVPEVLQDSLQQAGLTATWTQENAQIDPAALPEMPDRYQTYALPAEFQNTLKHNQVALLVGQNHVSVIPWGQWCLLEEMNHMMEQCPEAQFHFLGDSLASAHFHYGQDVRVIHTPYPEHLALGTVLQGKNLPLDPDTVLKNNHSIQVGQWRYESP